MPLRYRIRPLEVHAFQFDGTEAMAKHLMSHFHPALRPGYDARGDFAGALLLDQGGYKVPVGPGDWIVVPPRGGAFGPLLAFTDATFRGTFEAVSG